MVTMSTNSLEDRLILITGAAGHLGTAITHAVLAAGGKVIANSRNAASLDRLQQELKPDLHPRFHPVVADLATADGVAQIVKAVEKRSASLHGIVNNAYSGRVGPISAVETEDFAQACTLNLATPFLLARELGALLRQGGSEVKGGASVVNVASMYGKVSPDPSVYGTTGANNPPHYGATKAGLIQLTRYLACNFAPELVRFNSVSPGPFPNQSNQSSPGFIEELSRRVPMKRTGTAEEIGGPIIFLLSAAASYVNGADLSVDGGWTAW